MLKLFRYLSGPSVETIRCCVLCIFRGFSCIGVAGGEGDGVELSDEEFSDGNVANVQYEPSDSPSLEKQKENTHKYTIYVNQIFVFVCSNNYSCTFKQAPCFSIIFVS